LREIWIKRKTDGQGRLRERLITRKMGKEKDRQVQRDIEIYKGTQMGIDFVKLKKESERKRVFREGYLEDYVERRDEERHVQREKMCMYKRSNG
jgi:hypothetical protein